MLVGRAAECAAIDDVVAGVRAGHGQGLVLLGDAGIGKTALLAYAAEAADRIRVLRISGVEPEMDIGYAALHRLVQPVLDDVHRLPPPQASALEVALGRAEGPTPDRFLVALASLSLLAEAAGEQPVLCLVDDAQWTDGASLDAMAFAGRRLAEEPIAVVFAMRSDDATQWKLRGMATLPVAGLAPNAASALLDRHHGSRLSPAQRRRVLAAAGGNPLALRELPEAVLDGRGTNEPMPLTAGLQEAFLDQVRRRDEATQRLLLVVAADGSGRLETLRAAAAALGLTVDALDDGQVDDLVLHDGERLVFRHPLVRAAVYHGASPAERRAAHRALAAALAGDPAELHRHAWHLGQTSEQRDEHAAALLERSARQTSRRAGQAAAAAALSRAAELSESEASRGRRLVAAAEASWQGGDVGRARELLEKAEAVEHLSPAARLDLAELRARLELLVGTPADGLAPLRAVVPEALRADVGRAMPLLMTYGEIAYRADPAAWVEIGDWIEGIPLEGDTADDALYRLFRGGCRARIGKDPGMRSGDLDAVEQLTDPVKLTRAAGLTWAVGAYGLGRRLRRQAVKQARAIGAAGTLAWALEHEVFDALTRSRFGTAEAYVDEGYQLAVETGQPNTACRQLSMRAWLAALQGRADEARSWAEAVLTEAAERQLAECLAYAHHALGHLELVAGAYHEAVVHYDAMGPRRGPTPPSGPALLTTAELVEALVRSNQLERAAEQAARFERWTGRTASPELQALTARCDALLASGDEADRKYRHSLALHALGDSPLEQARTELLYGEHLRRVHRRSDAQSHLRSALETFRRLGAQAWAERAQDELRASGGAGSSSDPAVLATLTPQERRIALAVSEGATNREVAAQLFLSPRTVDYHLRKIFQKAGIRSRAELMRLVLTDLPRGGFGPSGSAS